VLEEEFGIVSKRGGGGGNRNRVLRVGDGTWIKKGFGQGGFGRKKKTITEKNKFSIAKQNADKIKEEGGEKM